MPKRKRGLKFQEAEAEAEAEAGVGWPAPAPMTSAQVLRQAELEGLKLLVGKSKTGFYAVNHDGRSEALPYRLNYRPPGCGITTFLGSFATAEEAALCFARTPEGQSAARAAEVAAAVPPLTSEEAVQRLQARKLLCPRVHELLKRSGLASQAALCAELNKMAQPEADAITKSALSNWLSGGRGNGRAVTEQLDASCQAWVDAHEAMEAAAGGAEAMQAARAAKEAAAKEVAKAEKIAAKAAEAAAKEAAKEAAKAEKRDAKAAEAAAKEAAKAQKAQAEAQAKAEEAQPVEARLIPASGGGVHLMLQLRSLDEKEVRRRGLRLGLEKSRDGNNINNWPAMMQRLRDPRWQQLMSDALAAQPDEQRGTQRQQLLRPLVQLAVKAHAPVLVQNDEAQAPMRTAAMVYTLPLTVTLTHAVCNVHSSATMTFTLAGVARR